MATDEAECRNFSAANLQWSAACLDGNCELQRGEANYSLTDEATLSSSLVAAAAAANASLMMGHWAQHNGLQNFVLVLTTYVTPIFVGVGLVTNTMSLLVFAGTYLKHQSMSVYLAALACADSVFLVSLLMHWLAFVSVNVIAVQGICQLVIYASFCSCFLSIWFLVSCSVERYIAICHPLRKPEMCTTRRACAVVLGLVIFCCMAYSVTLWMAGVSVTRTGHRVCEPVRAGESETRRMGQVVADVIATLVLPFLVIVLLNTAISKSMALFYRGQHQALTVVDSYSSASSAAFLLVSQQQQQQQQQPCQLPLLQQQQQQPQQQQQQQQQPQQSSTCSAATPGSLANIHQSATAAAATAAVAVSVWSRQTSVASVSKQNHGGRTSLSTRPPAAALMATRGGGGGSGSGKLQTGSRGAGSGGGAAGGRKHATRTVSSSLYTRAQMKLTKMLLLLSSLFLLFNLPDYVMRLHMLLQTISGTPGSHTQYMLAEIFHFAHNVTFATKFILFYMCSAKFREAFRRFWWQASYKVVRGCRALVKGRRSDTDDSTSDLDREAIVALSAHAHRHYGAGAKRKK